MKFSPSLRKKPSPNASLSEDSIDVIIAIHEKKSVEESVEVANEGITLKVNDKVVSTADGEEKFVDDLQQVVEEEAPMKDNTNVFGKLMFWKSNEKPAEEEKKESEESQEQEQEQTETESTEEAKPTVEAEIKTEAEAEAKVEVEVAEEKEETPNPFCFIQEKLTFWQKEAAKEEEQPPVSEEPKQAKVAGTTEADADAEKEAVEDSEAEPEKKEIEDEVFSHKIQVFVDGVAIQTIRLTNAGMDHLKNFMTTVQEEARLKGASASDAVTKSWLVEKMTEFFESAKNQGDAAVVKDPVEEEQNAEIETKPTKRSWWPFNMPEEEVPDEVRNTLETTEVEVKEDKREVAEAA